MWIKQFIRETLNSLFWSFDDNYSQGRTGGISIKSGECDGELEQYFEKSEIDEIKSFIGQDDPSYSPYYDKNITQKFGVIVDGRREHISDSRVPSQWEWCSWKLTRDMLLCGSGEVSLLSRLSSLFRCDGKCNPNHGDNQRWNDGGFDYGDLKMDDWVSTEEMCKLQDNIG